MSQRLGVGAEELARRDSLQVLVEGLSPCFETFLVEFVERGKTRDGQVGWVVIQL